MKHLILLIFLFILNFLNAGQNILKLLVKEKIEIYGTKLKILYKVSDKNDLVTLFYVDSINITLKINEIYCYYDFAKKEVITKEIYENTWFNRENNTNVLIFLFIMADSESWGIQTKTIKCKKIKRTYIKKNEYNWKILTSENKIEYSNKKFDIGNILYYTNTEGLLSQIRYKKIENIVTQLKN